MHKQFTILSSIIFCFIADTLWASGTKAASFSGGIVINEFMASNDNVATDETGEASDWIEIYNGTGSTVDLNGLFISDDFEDLEKHELEGLPLLSAGDRIFLWASGNTNISSRHLGFSLSASGEWLGLIAADGSTLLDSLSFGPQRTDVSFGRLTDGASEFRYFSPASFDAPNESQDAYLGFLEPPTFSHLSGFYQNSFNLNLTHSDNSVQIFYSKDGSIPKASAVSPVEYDVKFGYPFQANSSPHSLYHKTYQSYAYPSGGVSVTDPANESNNISLITTTYHSHLFYTPQTSIDKCRVLSAIAYKEGYLPSEQVTQTYFFNTNGLSEYQMPIISLAVQPNFLFDYHQGIYVAGSGFDQWRAENPSVQANEYSWANYRRTGAGHEYQASLTFFDLNSQTFEQNVGVRVNGATSRALQQKSLRLYARSEYGKNTLDYKFFDELSDDSFKRLILYNSGQDLYTLIKDLSAQQALAHLDTDTQAGKPSVLFINGEFWGIHHIRQRYDKYYFANKYGVDPENLDITKTVYPSSTNMEEGDPSHYLSISSYIHSHSLSSSSEYNYVSTQIDIDNFIDYHIAEIFFANSDWAGGNNHGLWREKVPYDPTAPKGRDGRWRWFLYDMDSALTRQFIEENHLSYATNSNFGEATIFLRKLLNNDEFKKKFITRFSDLLNTSFKHDYVAPILLANKAKIEGGIVKHIERWGTPPNYNFREISTDDVLESAQLRPNIQKGHIKSKFGLGSLYDLTVDVSSEEEGYVQVNTIEILSSTKGISGVVYPWTGEYYEDIPVEITAKPKLGHKFLHWEYNGATLPDSVLTVSLTQNKSYKAIFAEDFLSENPLPTAFQMAPCGYSFSSWDEESPEGTFPASMAFVYMNQEDPLLSAEIEGFTDGDYDHGSKTRINGLGEDGISFINTGSGNSGYPDTKLGGALLAVNTTNLDSLKLAFSAGTMTANPREYNLRLQYRIGDKLPFKDFLDTNNNPVEYTRSATDGHSESFMLDLPPELLNRSYVQFFWRYYYTDFRNEGSGGARDEIRLDDIKLFASLKLSDDVISNSTYNNFREMEVESAIFPAVNLILNAGTKIELKPGFETNQGTVFNASLVGCPE